MAMDATDQILWNLIVDKLHKAKELLGDLENKIGRINNYSSDGNKKRFIADYNNTVKNGIEKIKKILEI